MKKCFLCQIADNVTEGIVSTILAPTLEFATRQFKTFVDNAKGVKGDFTLYLIDDVNLPETFSEVTKCSIISDDSIWVTVGGSDEAKS